jgi:hypothetical protein
MNIEFITVIVFFFFVFVLQNELCSSVSQECIACIFRVTDLMSIAITWTTAIKTSKPKSQIYPNFKMSISFNWDIICFQVDCLPCIACIHLLFSDISSYAFLTLWDTLSYERSKNSVFIKFKLNLCVLSEVNIPITDFEHRILFWSIPTVRCTAYSLPVSYSALRWNEVCFTFTSK